MPFFISHCSFSTFFLEYFSLNTSSVFIDHLTDELGHGHTTATRSPFTAYMVRSLKNGSFTLVREQKAGGGGENCTPDGLLCRETPYCLGYAAFNIYVTQINVTQSLYLNWQRLPPGWLFLAESVALTASAHFPDPFR